MYGRARQDLPHGRLILSITSGERGGDEIKHQIKSTPSRDDPKRALLNSRFAASALVNMDSIIGDGMSDDDHAASNGGRR